MKFKNAEPVDNNNTEISQEVSSAEDSDNDKTEENNMDLSENNDSSNETNSETNSENSSDNEVVTPPGRLNPRHHQNLQTLQWMTLYL